MEYSSSFEFGNSGANLGAVLNKNLSSVSTNEINSFVDRVSFYIKHFDVLTRKNTIYSNENKITFLKRLKSLLLNELETRNVKV